MTDSAPVNAPAPHDPYVALRHREFRWYIVSLFAMTLGSQLQAVVVGWQVYSITHDPLALGLIGLAEVLPFIAVALPAGYLADRLNRRTVAVAGLAVLALCAAALLALTATPGLLARTGVFPIYAVIFASGIARSLLQPARQALSSELVPREHLQNAIAWRSSSWQIAAVAGPAIGGLLYGFSGPVAAYSVDVALMVCALAGMTTMRYVPGERVASVQSIGANLLMGLKFVFGQPVILAAMSLDLFSVFLGGAEALLPVFASEVLHVGPQGLGILRAAPAAGAVTMGLYLAHRRPFERAGRSMLLAVSGMADSVSVVIRSTLLQMLTPPDMLGRASAVNSIFVGSSNELGAFESGVAAKLFGAVPAVVIGGAASLLVVALTAKLVPALRKLERIS